jgi:hypothetical protein
MIKDFKAALRFAYTGRIGPEFKVRRVTVDKTGATEQARATIVVLFSWVLSIVLLLCVVAEIIYPLLGKQPPEHLWTLGSLSLGYLGGILSAFFGLKSGK